MAKKIITVGTVKEMVSTGEDRSPPYFYNLHGFSFGGAYRRLHRGKEPTRK